MISAGVAARRAQLRGHAAGLAARVNWEHLGEALRQRRLLPTLGPRILDLAEGRASDEFAAAVEQAVAATRRHAMFLQFVSLRVIRALAEAEIRCAPLKGPLLGEAIYGDPGRRIAGDVDLLVATEQLPAAVEVVRGLGYRSPDDHLDDDGLPLLHLLLVHEREELPPVELHWRVHYYERSFARERLLPPTAGGAAEWRPTPADELVALLLFYARDGFVDLRLASDVSAWWDARGAELQVNALGELLRDYPALERVVRTAVKVAERVVGLPAERAYAGMPTVGVRDRVAARLANPNPRSSQAQLYADIGLIDGLLAPPGGFGGFVRRQLLPSREFLEELDRLAPKRRARSSLRRGAGMLGRYALTMARLAIAPDRTRL